MIHFTVWLLGGKISSLGLSFSHPRTHITCTCTVQIVYILFKVTEAQYAPVFLLGVSFQECKCLGPRHSVIYLLIYLCTHLPVPLCLPVAHSSLLSASMSPMGPGTPPLAPLCPLHTHTRSLVCACIYTLHVHTQTEGENIQLRSLLRCFVLPSPCYCQLCWGPIIQSVHDHAQRSLHLEHQQSGTLSLLDSEHCGGALLEAIESDLIPTLAFCQQRLHSDERNGSSGQTNLLLYVSCGQIEYVQETGRSFVFLVRNRYE